MLYPEFKPTVLVQGAIYFDKTVGKFYVYKNNKWKAKEINITERVTQVLVNDTWVTVEFSALKKGDMFKQFNPDGTKVFDENGYNVFVATSDAFSKGRGKNLRWSIEIAE